MRPELLHILRHSLGFDDAGNGQEYRNRFVTDPEIEDGVLCRELCIMGFMLDAGPQSMCGGMHCYMVTPEGRRFVRGQQPPALTRSQRRYRQFLNEDCGMSFGEWLKARSDQLNATAP